MIVAIWVGSGRYITIYTEMFEPFARTVPDPRSARQEQFEAQGESLGRLPPPRVLLLSIFNSIYLSGCSRNTNKMACLANKRKNNICAVWLSIFNSACLAVQKTWLFNKTACLSLAFIWLCVRTNTFKCKWLYICLYLFVRAQVWVRNQLLINYVDVIIVCDDCCISWLFD